MPDHPQAAPGDLETVRRFLNTWVIPNDTRVAIDRLPTLLADPAVWNATLSTRPRHRRDSLIALRQLRSDLRGSCENAGADTSALNAWLARASLSMKIHATPAVSVLRIAPADASFTAFILSTVANAVLTNEWPRLKACADCRWVFYDTTRNGSKRWCGMTKGGADGRACGTIAKVKAYRSRQRVKRTGDDTD